MTAAMTDVLLFELLDVAATLLAGVLVARMILDRPSLRGFPIPVPYVEFPEDEQPPALARPVDPDRGVEWPESPWRPTAALPAWEQATPAAVQ